MNDSDHTPITHTHRAGVSCFADVKQTSVCTSCRLTQRHRLLVISASASSVPRQRQQGLLGFRVSPCCLAPARCLALVWLELGVGPVLLHSSSSKQFTVTFRGL